MTPAPFHRLEAIASRLPFAVDDYAAAGAAFARWKDSRRDEDLRTVEIWSYCYTYRYFYAKFARERVGGASDLDAAIDKAYVRVLTHLDSVRNPLKFAHFVSVICKRTLLNHRSRRRETVEVMEDMAPTRSAGASDYDGHLVRHVLAAAIGALPDAIRDIARMRLLDGMEYEAIAEETGRPTPTVRTYVSKAVARLREDEDLRALYFDDLLPPSVERSLTGKETNP